MTAVEIAYRPIEQVDTIDQLQEVAEHLSRHSGVYLLANEIATPDAHDIVSVDEQVLAARYWLSEASGSKWLAQETSPRTFTSPDHDYGIHGNASLSYSFHNNDYIHLHHTSRGALTLTTARATHRYEPSVNTYLSALLENGLTDTRFVEPDSYQQAKVEAGISVLFRLNEPDGRCLLHDFATTEFPRTSTIHMLGRTVSGTYAEFYTS
jgi:hypothetical protein